MPQTCHSCHTTDATFFREGCRVAAGQGGWLEMGGGSISQEAETEISRDPSDFSIYACCETTDLLFNQAKRGSFL